MSNESDKTINYLTDLKREAKEGKLYLALTSAKLALDTAEEFDIDLGIEVENLVYEARKNYLPKLYQDIQKSLRELDSSDKFYDDDIHVLKLKILKLTRHARLTGKLNHYKGQILKFYETLEKL